MVNLRRLFLFLLLLMLVVVVAVAAADVGVAAVAAFAVVADGDGDVAMVTCLSRGGAFNQPPPHPDEDNTPPVKTPRGKQSPYNRAPLINSTQAPTSQLSRCDAAVLVLV